ncbi:hypothetical protein [Atlantibacter sp.]|uniref:hypothetical protein n=1 Tax=Atlantibacter sp. TaxID=1903473 RepID=UPI0028ABF02B|nr:hypothetical protein [Atlantibacter sp.]
MKDMTHKQLIRATYVAAKYESAQTAQLLTELAGRLDGALAAARTACLERDAAVRAEIEWEKAMMLAVGEDGVGDVIIAIEQLKSQRDALAAECESKKSALIAILEHCPVNHPNIDAGIAAMIAHDNLYCVKTPATDVFLTKVRRQGVIEFAAAMAAIHAECQKGGYFDRQVKVYAKAQELAESYLKQRCGEQTA